MKYVYMINSLTSPDRFYTGTTTDLKRRLADHNAGQSLHTKKFVLWRLVTYIAFSNHRKEDEFELYLKTSSGRTFARRHF